VFIERYRPPLQPQGGSGGPLFSFVRFARMAREAWR
jgi:hypothetical protein